MLMCMALTRYIENPEEARAYRKGIPWEGGDGHH
eukprot:COSAG01_NODE_5486_length_4230_cov_2.267974_2_plen_34_part_00